jgi:hypothetical protein
MVTSMSVKQTGAETCFCKPLLELSLQLARNVGGTGATGQIRLLLRILLQVVEHVSLRLSVDRELVAACAQHDMLAGAAFELAELTILRLRGWLSQHRPKRAREALRRRNARGFEHRREDIDVLHQRFAHRVRRDLAGPAYEQRDAHGRLVKCPFPQATMIAEHFAMIGQEDDHQVREPALAFEGFQDAADLMVDERNLAVVVGADLRYERR